MNSTRSLSLVITLLFGTNLFATTVETSITSEVLGEERNILISLPDDYAEESRSYPLLISLDGETQSKLVFGTVDWMSNQTGEVDNLITVSIPNVNRNRDFTSDIPEGQNAQDFSGAASFQKFILDELIPMVERKYRVSGFKVIYGHSAGGLFVLDTVVKYPQLFDAAIVLSPFLNFNRASFFSRLESGFELKKYNNMFIFLATGDEPMLKSSITQLIERFNLVTNDSGFYTEFHEFDEESHMSVVSVGLRKGLNRIAEYRGWVLPKDIKGSDFDGIVSHYNKLSMKFDSEIAIPPRVITSLVDEAVKKGNFQKAIDIMQNQVSKSPKSEVINKDLGILYIQSGDINEGLKHLNAALDIAKLKKSASVEELESTIKYVESLK